MIGFGVGIVIAALGGGTAVGELLLLDSSGYVLAGLLGGFVAGFISGSSARTGAFTGGLASVFGRLVVLGIVVVLGTLFSGIVASAAVLVLGVLFLAIYAIPGAIGGVIGAAVKDRRESGRRTRRAA
ncbi:DUF5518 domain-containing protein [Natrialba taiwanensis]|uniref:Uncharacterized protein n=1 Tax=Natrialba taiwanensis DSM 12281 TaxID=1230458 RepID=M0A0H2_9EURY|nr:DUF5518 domain-containing protein [Natrialba taiwanensis]ELY92255.1 hypothetical protein C484_09721 [Natrialba taiwanensis DSM 12281]